MISFYGVWKFPLHEMHLYKIAETILQQLSYYPIIFGHPAYTLIVNNATQNKFQAILGDTSADYLASIAAYVSCPNPMMIPD
jgi:hypothetical protein